MLISKADPRGVWATAADELELRILSYGMDPRQWDATGKQAHALVKAWNWYRELGQTFERVNKIAGMLHLDEKFPAMPEWQKREIVRERAGSPDFLRRGASSSAADVLMMFYNPWKEGLRSVVKSAGANPYQFTGKMLLIVAAPTTLMALLAGGAGGDDKREQYQAIPDYDLSNYLVYPLGWMDKQQRKVAYIRLPLWEPARIFHGLLWHTLTGRGQSVNAYLGGQVPGLSPVLGALNDWGQFVAGRNPYDSFRGREIVDPDVFASDKGAAAVELAKHTWNQFGGGILKRFENAHLNDPEPGEIERFLRLPGVSNLVGRWIKVSNRGVFEADRKIADEVANFLDEYRPQWRDDLSQDDAVIADKVLAYGREKMGVIMDVHLEPLRKTLEQMTGWRMEGTLREFAPMAPRCFWFRHPFHTMDQADALGDAKAEGEDPQGKAQADADKEARKARREQDIKRLSEAFMGPHFEHGFAELANLASTMNLDEKRVKALLPAANLIQCVDGKIRPKEEGEEFNEANPKTKEKKPSKAEDDWSEKLARTRRAIMKAAAQAPDGIARIGTVTEILALPGKNPVNTVRNWITKCDEYRRNEDGTITPVEAE
jgi:hypothetical protein